MISRGLWRQMMDKLYNSAWQLMFASDDRWLHVAHAGHSDSRPTGMEAILHYNGTNERAK